MKNLACFTLLVLLSLNCAGKTESRNGGAGKTKGNSKEPVEPALNQRQVIAEIKSLGAGVTLDQKSPQKPVIEVFLMGAAVTDAVVERLKALTELQTLWLTESKVTDTGLAHLKKLARLKHLYLGGSRVTDAGLAHLTGMTNLEDLDLSRTKVTDAGVTKLKAALPKCEIMR